jgi:hypothetical protein
MRSGGAVEGPEDMAKKPRSFTGQYLRPLREKESGSIERVTEVAK